jgi:hypothetical protein
VNTNVGRTRYSALVSTDLGVKDRLCHPDSISRLPLLSFPALGLPPCFLACPCDHGRDPRHRRSLTSPRVGLLSPPSPSSRVPAHHAAFRSPLSLLKPGDSRDSGPRSLRVVSPLPRLPHPGFARIPVPHSAATDEHDHEREHRSDRGMQDASCSPRFDRLGGQNTFLMQRQT